MDDQKYSIQEAFDVLDGDMDDLYIMMVRLIARVTKLERELETERRLRLAMKGR